MYEGYNCGEKIKVISQKLVVLGWCGAAIIGVLSLLAFLDEGWHVVVALMVVAIEVAVWCFACGWNQLLLYSFGELVSYVVVKRKSEYPSGINSNKSEENLANVDEVIIEQEGWECVFCGHTNSAKKTLCENCGLHGNEKS